MIFFSISDQVYLIQPNRKLQIKTFSEGRKFGANFLLTSQSIGQDEHEAGGSRLAGLALSVSTLVTNT